MLSPERGTLVLYELDSSGRGAKIDNHWQAVDGHHFVAYVEGGPGWHYVIPDETGKNGMRYVLGPGGYRVVSDGDRIELVGAPVGNDHQDAIDSFRESRRQSSLASCDVSKGPFLGPMIGLGFGGVLQAGPVGLRLQALWQYLSYPFFETKEEGDGVSVESKTHLTGSRGFLLAGIEL